MGRLASHLLPLLVAGCFAPPALAAEALADYAGSVPRTTRGGDAIHKLELPRAVYAGVQHADLRDVRGNAGDGIHGASAGGTWQAVVFGFAGLKVTPEGWTTTPRLPSHWNRVKCHFFHRGEKHMVDIARDA